MKIRNACASIAVLLTAMPASAALAQTPAAAANAIPDQPAIQGVCAYSHGAAMGTSKLGGAIRDRLNQIGQQTEAELKAQGDAFDGEVKAYQGQAATLTQQQKEQKELELRQKQNTLQQLVQVRQREIQITEQQVEQRFGQEEGPMLEQAIRERACGIVLDADSSFYVSRTMDITPSVVAKLDGKITTLAFDRANLEQLQAQAAAQQAAQAGGARPAAATPARPAATQPAKPRGR